MRYRGRPILGALAGLLLGAFVAVDLAIFGVRPLDEIGVYGLPVAGLLLGLLIGLWAPLGRGRARRKAGPAAPDLAEEDAAATQGGTPAIGARPSEEPGPSEKGSSRKRSP